MPVASPRTSQSAEATLSAVAFAAGAIGGAAAGCVPVPAEAGYSASALSAELPFHLSAAIRQYGIGKHPKLNLPSKRSKGVENRLDRVGRRLIFPVFPGSEAG